jgi:hypothetical protein
MSTCALCKQPPWHPSMDAGCGCNCTYEEMEAALRASTVTQWNFGARWNGPPSKSSP